MTADATGVDYAKYIFWLLVGLVVLAGATCAIVFGVVLPRQRDDARKAEQHEQQVDAIVEQMCLATGDC